MLTASPRLSATSGRRGRRQEPLLRVPLVRLRLGMRPVDGSRSPGRTAPTVHWSGVVVGFGGKARDGRLVAAPGVEPAVILASSARHEAAKRVLACAGGGPVEPQALATQAGILPEELLRRLLTEGADS